MELIETGFEGLTVIKPKILWDSRGSFMETYQLEKFAAAGIQSNFVQCNQSFSYKNVVRGLHMQKAPYEQAKLVRVLHGEILDVVVDYRVGSKTFGKHYKINLSSESGLMLFVPKGFLHGFVALQDTSFHYMVDNYYNGNSELGVKWNDADLNIDWNINDPIVSEKDIGLLSFRDFLNNLNT